MSVNIKQPVLLSALSTSPLSCVPLTVGDTSEQSSEASSAAEDNDQQSQSSGEPDDSAARPLWRAQIRRTDAADDARLRLEIGILSSEREGQPVLEVRHQPAVVSQHKATKPAVDCAAPQTRTCALE